MGQNNWRLANKIHIWNIVRLSLRGKNIIRNQILVSNVIHRLNLYHSKISIRKLKKEYTISSGAGKIQPPRHWAQLSICRGRLGILLFSLNYIKMKWIQNLLNSTNALWKDLMLYWLKLILNSDQDLAIFQQKQILIGQLVTQIYENRTTKISLFNYSMLGYISPITTSLPRIYKGNSCPTHILKPTYQTGL